MDDIIYIIIGIAWIGFGLYKNYQKQLKKQENSSQKTTSAAPQSKVKDIFEELFGVEEFKTSEPEKEELANVEIQSLEVEKEFEKYKTELKQMSKVENENKEVIKIKEVEEGNTILSDFDLRKAVIYSMILERRYS